MLVEIILGKDKLKRIIKMIGKIKDKLNKENGAVQIVEATFVFPIMFIILLFLIYMGNAHYIRAQIESIVVERAIAGANYCTDPILQTIKEEGKIPKLSDMDLDPYRYFSGMDEIEKKISRDVEAAIEGTTVSMFRNMKPVVKTPKSEIAKYNNHILYSTFSVEVKCAVEYPIKFLGESTPTIMEFSSRAEIAVNDTAEFIRNTDMAIDYFIDTKFGQSIKGVFDKINDFLNTFAKK